MKKTKQRNRALAKTIQELELIADITGDLECP